MLNEWISVSDDLPAYGVPVILSINKVTQHVTYMRDGADESLDWFEPYHYDDKENALFIDYCSIDLDWIPLPEPPTN